MSSPYYDPDTVLADRAARISELEAENARLREALQEIVDDPGGCPAEDVVDELQDVARRALEAKDD